MQESTTRAESRDIVSFVKRGVRVLEPYSLTIETYPIKLNQNESPYDLPDDIKRDVLERFLKADWSRYPPFYAFELAQQIAAINGVPESSILVGSGSNELCLSLMTAVVRPQDDVVFSVPTFPLYAGATHVMDGHIVPVPLTEPDFALNLPELIEKAVNPKTRIVFICTPNNPTGGMVPEEQIREIIRGTECLVVIDEAYYEFAGVNLASLVREEPRVVIMRTLSKAMAMAGLRVGYLVGNPDLMYEVSKVRLPYSVNAFAQEAALAVLQRPDIVKARIREVKAERAKVFAALNAVEGVTAFPSDANFLLVRFPDGPHVNRELMKRGILVRDVSKNPLLGNCLRITIGKPDENDALIAAVQGICAGPWPAPAVAHGGAAA